MIFFLIIFLKRNKILENIRKIGRPSVTTHDVDI